MAFSVASSASSRSSRSLPIRLANRSTPSCGCVEALDPLRAAMLDRVFFIASPSFDSSGNFDGRDHSLLGQTMSYDGHISSVEEIEHSILDGSVLCPQFINAVLKIIRRRASQLMSEHLE